MVDKQQLIAELYAGLRAFSHQSFPKRCTRCGRQFDSVDDFLLETDGVNHASGLREGIDDDEQPVVELFRNCPCGSTLMEIFGDRRDLSPAGVERRARFNQLLGLLAGDGMDPAVARQELRKVLHGEESPLLQSRGIDIQTH